MQKSPSFRLDFRAKAQRRAGCLSPKEKKKPGPGRETFIYVNNRLEGNALETIATCMLVGSFVEFKAVKAEYVEAQRHSAARPQPKNLNRSKQRKRRRNREKQKLVENAAILGDSTAKPK